MKKIVLLSYFALGFLFLNGQMAVGKKSIDGSGLLDFAQDSSKGIIISLVESLPTSPAQGTFVASKLDSAIYVYSNNRWVLLGVKDKGKLPTSFMDYTGIESDFVVVGSKTSSASGVLILESSNKSLILPKNTNPHLNMPQPRIGTICYDKTNKALSVYDGKKWTYWR